MFYTVNYLFATFLQTKDGGSHKIVRVEKLRPGKARFFFDVTHAVAEAAQMEFHRSVYMEFETLRKSTIDLAY